MKIDPAADMGFEGNETIVINGITIDGLNLKPATITIRDAQVQPSVTLTVDTDTSTAGDQSEISEDASSTVVTVTATLSDMTTLLEDATVTLSLGGSATRSTEDTTNDYTASDALTITILAGQSTGEQTGLQSLQ